MSIGIGITTYNRPECLKECLEHINKHTDMTNVMLYVATDTDENRRGVSKIKNECLRALKDCDHIFLFDDDCYPIKDGWVENWINSDKSHYLFMDSKLHRMIGKYTNDSYWADCGGVFMYFTKTAIENVGAFNEKFERWGFEHAEYSMRVNSFNGYTIDNRYWMLNNTSEYIYAADYSDPNHKSSISNEEKQKYFDLNFPKFKEPIKNIYIPL